jgi:hypothetical protein
LRWWQCVSRAAVDTGRRGSHLVPTRPSHLLLQVPFPPAPAKSLFGDSSDSDADVVADTQRAAAAAGAAPAARRVVSGLRAPGEGRAPPDALAPSPPSQADAATQGVVPPQKPHPNAVLAPWPEEAPKNLICSGCSGKFQKKSVVGICPDCSGPVHNNVFRVDCVQKHPGRKVYACVQCVKKASEKATSSKRLSSARID